MQLVFQFGKAVFLADIEVLAGSPYKLLAAGCGDIVAKYTAVKDWQLAHKLKNEYYGDYAADLALMSAELVTKNASEIVQRRLEGVRTVGIRHRGASPTRTDTF